MARPNFVFILLDDMGWTDLSCYGSEFYETPSIDRLEETTVAGVLQKAGYRTYHVGKWHLGGEAYYPEHHGFFSPWNLPTLENGMDGEFLTDRLTDEAIALLSANGSKPFFLNLWYYAGHTPIQAKEEDIAYFQEKARSMIRRVDENIGRLMAALDGLGKRDDTLVIFTSDNGGLATSEWSPTCNAPLSEGKGWMYEGGTREPLLVCRPGRIPGGSLCPTPVTSTHFFPTLLDAAGMDLLPEKHCDGVGILPLLRGDPGPERSPIFWYFPRTGGAMS